MKKTHAFDYISVLKYAVLLFVFTVFSRLESAAYPYSCAVLAAVLYMDYSVVASPLLYVGSYVITGAFGMLAQSAVTAAVFIIAKLVRGKARSRTGLDYVLFTAISLAGFMIIGDTEVFIPYEKRALVTFVTVTLSYLAEVALKAFSEKGLKSKTGFEENAAAAACIVAFGLGICNLLTPFAWKAVTVFCALFFCYIFRFGQGTFISALLGVSLAVYHGSIEYIAASLVMGMAADAFTGISRYAAAPAVIIADYAVYLLFGVYPGYTLAEFLPVLSGAALFCIIPAAPLKRLKERLYSFREKQLVRQTINRNRTMLSNRLYELSGVFTEMSAAFTAFSKNHMSEERAKTSFEKEIRETVCENCPNLMRCKKAEASISAGFKKLIDIGLAKGKLSLIDMPNETGAYCIRPNDILYGLNRMLAEYRSYAAEKENADVSRELLASETQGVSEILKELALESGTLLKYQSRLERTLSENLFKNGFIVSELLIYGEGDNISVCLILAMKEFSLTLLQSVIDGTLGMHMTPVEKTSVSEEKVYFSFRRAAAFDAVFGIAKAVKDGSDVSGDTHSVIRINEEKFLVALSDGMGSGKKAETVSSVSLSLIESFYRAGMDSGLILSTVNKLLAVNAEDSFTALDISVIDLKTCSADFIKYGAPYGFIVNDGAVRIVESNSLPLGILSDLSPSVCSAELSDGDMILLTTDGIADAFGGSSEIIDFLRKAPALNPQSLSEQVLKKAVDLAGGRHNDDMTALSVRVFKKHIPA